MRARWPAATASVRRTIPGPAPRRCSRPLYPTLLSLVFRVFGIYSLTSGIRHPHHQQRCFRPASCIPVYFSAKYSLGSGPANAAAWFWALYPFAIYFSAGRVWEYALTGLLFTTSFCIAQRIHRANSGWAWLGWGALCGAHGAVKSLDPCHGAVSAGDCALAGAWFRPPLVVERRCSHFVAILAVLVPWTVRNVARSGHSVPGAR